MTQAPQPPADHGVRQPPQGTNGLGIAGFIVSLVAICTAFILSPIGLLLSVIGLFKRPKGFAIAGTIIGGLGTISLVAMTIAFAVGGYRLFGIAMNYGQTMSTLQQANGKIIQYRQKQGSLPDEQKGNQLISGMQDAWGHSIRYRRQGPNDHVIVSPGEDARFDTGDDIDTDNQFQPRSGGGMNQGNQSSPGNQNTP